jgi:TonB family protein
MRWISRLVVFLLLVCTAALAQSSQDSAKAAFPQGGTYANSSDGLQNLIADILQAAKDKNKAREADLINSLLIPDGSAWFTDVYGPGFGASLAAAYQRAKPGLEGEITAVYEGDVARGWTTPKILRYTDPESVDSPLDHFLNSMNQIVPLYATAFQATRMSFVLSLKPGGGPAQMAGDLDGYFIYDQGGFRFVPMNVLMMLPSERPVRIHLDMNVMQSKVIAQVPIRTPEEAIQKRISGQVVLDVVLDQSGNIKELRVLEGDPVLSAAVMDAVKQWRFAPTTLDGDPVEVEFQMPVKFEIH